MVFSPKFEILEAFNECFRPAEDRKSIREIVVEMTNSTRGE